MLLGASNLTLGLRPALAAATANGRGPYEILIAAGHGRSYGRWSRVLARGLPGIVECGLWRRLARPGPPGHAFVADVGNDLAYGESPATVARWIDRCLARLLAAELQPVLARPPAAALRGLSRWRFSLLRALLFPGSPLSYRDLGALVTELDERLTAAARGRGIATVEPRPDWFGWDAIHLRRGCRRRAWESLASTLGAAPGGPASETLGVPGRRARYRAPERYTLFGLARGGAQPAARWSDGSRVSFF